MAAVTTGVCMAGKRASSLRSTTRPWTGATRTIIRGVSQVCCCCRACCLSRHQGGDVHEKYLLAACARVHLTSRAPARQARTRVERRVETGKRI